MLKIKLPKPQPPPPPPPAATTLCTPATPPFFTPSTARSGGIVGGGVLALLKQCESVRSLRQVHAHMLAASLHHPNHLLSKAVKLRDLRYATLLFSANTRPNEFSYNLMIRGLATAWADYASALRYYLCMLRSGHMPNHYTYPFVLVATANLQCLHYGLTAHATIFKVGLDCNDHIQHSLITMYSKCGELERAREVFDEIAMKDSVSWNSIISGYAKMGRAREAVGLFRKMETEGFRPDEVTLVSILTACRDLGDLRMGMELERLVEDNKFGLNSFVGSSLIDMYGKCGDLASARRVFDGMRKKDLAAWNAMITGYAQNGLSDEAIKLFYTLREAGIEPDKITVVGVLSACASVGALELGTWLDSYASENGLYSNVYVGTALIDMYAKCGNLNQAVAVFDSMPFRNVVSWNAIISAFASHGRGGEAISLFNQMRNEKESFHPNGITFVGVLSACVHAGLVDEGRRWFESMKSVYGITPTIEHYSCMADLLARAGLLEEAWDFIEEMPEKPDAVVLGALLSACRCRKNVEIGDKVVKRLLELEPSNSGNYVISSKLYAGSKRWEDSARMRGLMREKGVSKVPGSSWIEVENQFCEFHSGDEWHPKAVEIYEILDLLIDEMKIEGYVPNTE